MTVTATDAGSPAASDSESLIISVGRVNHPPLLAPIGNRVVDLGQSARIAIVASDADGDALTLACSGLPVGAVFTDLQDGTGEIVWAPSVASTSSTTCSAADDGTPPGAAQETFMLTARDPAPPAGAPVLDSAVWDSAHGSVLAVKGEIPPAALPRSRKRLPIEFFAVLADDTHVKLGARAAAKDGSFHATLATFIAPCRVAAAANGVMGAAIDVSGAPATCDTELLLRLRSRSSCNGFSLRVKGHRAPPGGLVIGTDGATGQSLFSLPSSQRGAFASKMRVTTFVDSLAITAQAAGYEWSMPVPASVHNKCRK